MKLSLGECVKFLLVLLQENEVKLPLHGHKPWHQLFYRLKKSEELQGKPDFFDTIRFNWDGSYPESPELSEFLHGLCVTVVVVCDSPTYENCRLTEDVLVLWKQRFEEQDEKAKQFINAVANIARQEFAPLPT